MREDLAELNRRLGKTRADKAAHWRAGRGIEAAACEIRIQALAEAVAILEGDPLPPNMMRVGVASRAAGGLVPAFGGDDE